MALFRGYMNPLSRIGRFPQVEGAAAEDQSREDTPTSAPTTEGHIMSREQSPVADLVQDMNEAAGKLPSTRDLSVPTAETGSARGQHGEEQGPRRSPRKRPSPRVLGPSPDLIKRRRTTDLQSSSGRLKRKSLPSQPRPPKQNRDSYEIQVEDSDSAAEAESARKALSPAAGGKQVRLLKKKAANLSPLKGQGEIEIPATSKVNFEDSPSKRPVGRPKKVVIRPRTKNDEDRAITTSAADPESRSVSPEDSNIDETSSRPRIIRQKKPDKGKPDTGEEQAVQVGDAEADGSDSGTARRGKTREEERREREDKREKDRAKELKGIERVANLHGWGTDLAWGDLFAAVSELVESKNATKPESRQGTRLCRKIHWIADRYRAENQESEYEGVAELPSISVDIQSLAKSIWQYPKNRVNAPNERAKKGRDIYGHVVLDLVRLLRKVLRNHQREGSFEQEVYDEMCLLLEASWNAADLACKWQPRPSQLDGGVLRLMRDDVRKNLGFLKEKYLAHRENYLGTKEAQTLDDVAKIQQKAQEHLWGPVRQRRQEILARNRRRVVANEAMVISDGEMSEGERNDQLEDQEAGEEINKAPNMQLGLLTPPSEAELLDKFRVLQEKNQEAQDKARKERWNAVLSKNRRRADTTGVVAATEQAVLDIDDIPSPPHSYTEKTSTPPRSDRAPTEEIPGPVQPPVWTEQERIVFQNLLQRYSGPSRFEQILKRYGGHRGLLQRHDLDSLTSFVNFLKESKTIEIRAKPEEWVWLTGVPR